MPTPSPAARKLQSRAAYARTSGNMLLGGPGSGVNTSDGPPTAFYWIGYDSGGGAWPIGPNGPFGPSSSAAVTRLTAIITDPLTAVPWKQVEQQFGGDILTTPRWMTDPMLLRPDDRFSVQVLPAVTRLPRTQFWASWVRSAVMFGIGYMLFLEDGTGQPEAGSMRVLNPQYVSPARDAGGTLVWAIGDGTETVYTDSDGYLAIGGLTWRLVALRDPHASIDPEGRSPSVFERHPDVFGLTHSIDSYTSGVFKSGVPAGYLKVQTPGLDQTAATELKKGWMNAHGGDRRSIAVLNATTDFTPISFNPVDAALIDSKRANMADLCMAFALDPAGALGISMGNSSTYSNVQQHFARLKTDLLPWIESVEQVVSSLLPQGRGMQMDFSELTRPDPKEQYEALKVAVDAGLLTLDEARNILGLPALPTTPEPAAPPVPVAVPTAVPAPAEQPVPPVRSLRRELAWRR